MNYKFSKKAAIHYWLQVKQTIFVPSGQPWTQERLDAFENDMIDKIRTGEYDITGLKPYNSPADTLPLEHFESLDAAS